MARISRQDAKRYLADVPDDQVFYCHDSCVFKNMRELKDGLASMADETYAYHVNTDKNDFSKWVADVIKDTQLAADLNNSQSRAEAVNRVDARIAALNRR